MKEASKDNQIEESAQKDDKKGRGNKKKKGKEAAKNIAFGKGLRILFDYLNRVYSEECKSDD